MLGTEAAMPDEIGGHAQKMLDNSAVFTLRIFSMDRVKSAHYCPWPLKHSEKCRSWGFSDLCVYLHRG